MEQSETVRDGVCVQGQVGSSGECVEQSETVIDGVRAGLGGQQQGVRVRCAQ